MDIKIGEGNHGIGAVKHSEKFNFVSQNNVSYWCHDVLFDKSLIIMKDTKEGKKLTNYLNGGIQKS